MRAYVLRRRHRQGENTAFPRSSPAPLCSSDSVHRNLVPSSEACTNAVYPNRISTSKKGVHIWMMFPRLPLRRPEDLPNRNPGVQGIRIRNRGAARAGPAESWGTRARARQAPCK